MKISAHNIFAGAVTKINKGRGNIVSSIITFVNAIRFGLKAGGQACAMFKASIVIIGIC